ncbi:DSBA-like thioredoxin domain-containing protein [Streptomyces sp. TLI_053]|uniref:DsbA family protein n=1 Tax=Streptomyces sp. TLI_053 TaxID=1855352 RepID=UPI00087DEC03|nr:DsbA family protein [Streptomyces sp. TLI_053]SDT79943.1 DSBA-like thioredoxin domain-containing protein [Streptomyces sp. TLI_053]
MIEGSLPRLEFWCELQCTDCRTALDDVRELRARYGDALPIELRHFPLEKHKHAYAAAEAAEEAFAQGLGWPFVEALLARVEDLSARGTEVLLEVAREVGVDPEEVDTALVDGRHMLTVDADQAEGRAIGVKGTPTYVIAGQRFDGGQSQDGLLERLVAAVDAAAAPRKA